MDFKDKFFVLRYQGDAVINLENVMYVKFDEARHKIIFSYAYSIKVQNIRSTDGSAKLIPDYTYYYLNDEERYQEEKERLLQHLRRLPQYRRCNLKFDLVINFNCVTLIKYSYDENRVILNFCSPSSFVEKGVTQVTGYFLYIDISRDKVYTFAQRVQELVNGNTDFELFCL